MTAALGRGLITNQISTEDQKVTKMDADMLQWENLYCTFCSLQVSGWLNPLGPGNTHAHMHTHFHLLITQMQQIYLSLKNLFICLHEEACGECVSSSWVTLEFFYFLDRMFGYQR